MKISPTTLACRLVWSSVSNHVTESSWVQFPCCDQKTLSYSLATPSSEMFWRFKRRDCVVDVPVGAGCSLHTYSAFSSAWISVVVPSAAKEASVRNESCTYLKISLFLFSLHFTYFVCMCMCSSRLVCMHTHTLTREQLWGVGSLFPLCAFQGLNSVFQAWVHWVISRIASRLMLMF